MRNVTPKACIKMAANSHTADAQTHDIDKNIHDIYI